MCAYAAENLRKKWFTGEEHTKMKLNILSGAEIILNTLEQHGYEAYVCLLYTSVEMVFRKLQERRQGGEEFPLPVQGPKKLGVFGASYLYPVLKLSLIHISRFR